MQTHFVPRPFPFSSVTDQITQFRPCPLTLCVGCKTIFVPVVTFTSRCLWAAFPFCFNPLVIANRRPIEGTSWGKG